MIQVVIIETVAHALMRAAPALVPVLG